jgi:hypothetical protein
VVGFIIVIAVLVVLFLILASIYKKVTRIMGRLNDFFITKKSSLSGTSAFIFLIGFFVLLFNITRMNSNVWFSFRDNILPGLVLMGLPLLWLLIRYRGDFFKVFIVKLITIPVCIVFMITYLFVGHRKEKVVERTNISRTRGTRTTYRYKWPSEIIQGEYALSYVYNVFGAQYYENYDGTRCVVEHKRTLTFNNLQYEVYPLYNVSDPLPRWVAWLYGGNAQPVAPAPAAPASYAPQNAVRPGVTITLSQNVYAPGAPITCVVAGTTADMVATQAYASIYAAGASHAAYGDYVYLPEGAAQCSFTAPVSPGGYEMRVYQRDGDYTDDSFVASVPFSVAAEAGSVAPTAPPPPPPPGF